MSKKPVDIAVVGGGLAGLAAARAITLAGFDCVHIAPSAPVDRRTSALMRPSADFLKQIGLFDVPLELGTPLKRIRIIDASARLLRAPETLFDSAEVELDSFGWNFPNARMAARFDELADGEKHLRRIEGSADQIGKNTDGWNITLRDGTKVAARLIVGADGKKSAVRQQAGIAVSEHAYEQSALVCDLELMRPLDGESIEFHYPNGPFTLVPAQGNRANLVWIDQQGELEAARNLEKAELERMLTEKAKRLFGPVKTVSPAFVFPLSTLEARQAAADGIVLVGEAAHAFPPIGAQGLNLGLRDVRDLMAALEGVDKQDADWPGQVSKAYAAARASDIRRTGQFVSALFSSLLSEFLPAQALRSGGLWALKLSPQLREKAFETGMGARQTSA